MFWFQAAAFATLATVASASVSSYAGYEPVTVVADHAAIASDQKLIEQYVGTVDGFSIAQDIYTMGGNSKSYAEIILPQGPGVTIPKGTEIKAIGNSGLTVTGTALDTYESAAMVIGFQYPTSDSNENHVMCRVGGLDEADQETSGCLRENTTLTIPGVTEALTAVEITNKNARTLQDLSSEANTKMRPGEDTSKDFYSFFIPYVKYYGTHDFADQIVLAGFSGTSTAFDNGDIDLSGYGVEARAQIIKKGTAYISALLYAQRALYDAVNDCQEECEIGQCNDDSVHANDEAAAFFVGNQYDADEIGNLGYALGEKRCPDFATCVDTTTNPTKGQSYVNQKIIRELNAAKVQFGKGDCQLAQKTVDEIIRLMQIPLIQATLRYAELVYSFESPTAATQAEGAIFAAGILPRVHACNPEKAQIIYDSMKLNNDAQVNFLIVKDAFESVYDCLGVTCAEIGGIVDEATGNTYIEWAAPCGGVNNFASAASSLYTPTTTVIGLAASMVGAATMVLF